MPSLRENLTTWTAHDWSHGGDEWSRVWGGSSALWWGCLYPRLAACLPAATLLEIAPGAGRFTQFLAPWTERLILVDLTPRCIELCRERFRSFGHTEFHVNDGSSLPMVADSSVDFAFSFDSLVHADSHAVTGYVREFARVLRPGGRAFLHHSNLARFRDPASGELAIENPHWRDPSVSAVLVRDEANARELTALCQEEINWGHHELTDCLTLLERPIDGRVGAGQRLENPRFMLEAAGIAERFALWSGGAPDYLECFRRITSSGRGGWLERLMGRP